MKRWPWLVATLVLAAAAVAAVILLPLGTANVGANIVASVPPKRATGLGIAKLVLTHEGELYVHPAKGKPLAGPLRHHLSIRGGSAAASLQMSMHMLMQASKSSAPKQPIVAELLLEGVGDGLAHATLIVDANGRGKGHIASGQRNVPVIVRTSAPDQQVDIAGYEKSAPTGPDRSACFEPPTIEQPEAHCRCLLNHGAEELSSKDRMTFCIDTRRAVERWRNLRALRAKCPKRPALPVSCNLKKGCGRAGYKCFFEAGGGGSCRQDRCPANSKKGRSYHNDCLCKDGFVAVHDEPCEPGRVTRCEPL